MVRIAEGGLLVKIVFVVRVGRQFLRRSLSILSPDPAELVTLGTKVAYLVGGMSVRSLADLPGEDISRSRLALYSLQATGWHGGYFRIYHKVNVGRSRSYWVGSDLERCDCDDRWVSISEDESSCDVKTTHADPTLHPRTIKLYCLLVCAIITGFRAPFQ